MTKPGKLLKRVKFPGYVHTVSRNNVFGVRTWHYNVSQIAATVRVKFLRQ